ncbi:thioredoxin-like protein CITRX, chloroplastic [Physcomitrium patens]|uniref:Thioredoxin domain-containing protein n=1 Tax=Physcomitrium patens TaxID=3218 RepID=A0A2K1L8P6_PHYPA|nr:thioredoxin-like protein CITRX, chloroplastic [Physcomitrium patens]XP_024393669.1 thioredoxin-like protein CITRX, chloroplastic [Physcomitrium patens]PNR62382.1 hypothetical protein PHYPA_000806 [Physcomitrium patens]|eukprot:XP_024393582.1 thioredoxin-like protein CITRX, chloroplastic [Physcomitrella patens]
MAASVSMASLTSTPCLPQPQRVTALTIRHQVPSRANLVYKAGSQSLSNSNFNGVRLEVRTPNFVRPQSFALSVRAAGAKGDYLVKKVSASELDEILSNERDLPIVVDFYATWCGPCIFLAQELEQLAVEYTDNVRFLKIDTDEEHEFCSQMQIRGLPTMVFISPDEEKLAIRTEGLLSTNVIRDIIEKELGASQWDPEWHPDEIEKEAIPQWDVELESR